MKQSLKKMSFLFIAYFIAQNCLAATGSSKAYKFEFKNIKKPIIQTAATQADAFKMAAKQCFSQLTGDKYPGEEKGLEIIDICANPKMSL